MQELKKIIKEQDLTFIEKDKIIELLEKNQELVSKASIYQLFNIEDKEFFKTNRFSLKRKKKLIEALSKKIAGFLPAVAKKTPTGKVASEFEIKGHQRVFAFSSNFVKFDKKTGIGNFSSEGMLLNHSLANGYFDNIKNEDSSNIDMVALTIEKLQEFENIQELKNFLDKIEKDSELIFNSLEKFKAEKIASRK